MKNSDEKTKKIKFYSLKKILTQGEKIKAKYYMIFGERSNGKTYSVKELGLNGFHSSEINIDGYIQNGRQFAIVRRWDDDFKGKRGESIFNDLSENGSIAKWTNNQWDRVAYRSKRWYLAKFDEQLDKVVRDEKPFAYGFSLSTWEHDKMNSFPEIDMIMFDEFLTRGTYLPDEFVAFMNIISTIARHDDRLRIFMLGNTVNKYCPYFQEMGLKNITKMKPGDIDIYQYGNSKLSAIVEYANTAEKQKKASDIYFAFDNPKLQMITGGAWEMAIYPHCPCKYKFKDILFTYFIVFGEETLQCEIIQNGLNLFTYIHRKTTPLKDTDNDLIYSTEWNMRPNYARKLTKPANELQQKILSFFKMDKVFYQDNSIGEVVRNYLLWCQGENFK